MISGSEEDKITLRPVANADDHDFLLTVYASTRAAEMAQVPWSSEQKDAFIRMQFTAQMQQYAVEFPQASHDVIVRNGVPVGRIYMDRNADRFHILDITVLPQYQRAGIGSALLRRVLEEAGTATKPVTIHVESFNPSLGLFRKLGFEPVSEIGFHLLLRWALRP